MRYLILCALVLAGCGSTRTSNEPGGTPPPVYPESRDQVFDAAVAVFHSKFKRLESSDRSAYVVSGVETNFPGGDTTVTATLVEVPGGTEVDVDAEAGPTSSPGWNKNNRDFHNFLNWLDEEIQIRRQTPQSAAPVSATERLRELEALHTQGLITDDEYAAKHKAIIDGL